MQRSTELMRLRIALTAFFALGGFLFAGWSVRIPAVKEQVSASAGALGLALFAMSASAVVTMAFTGRLCARFGSRRVVVVAASLLALCVVLPATAHSSLTLAGALVLFGVAYGAIDVAINSAAVDLIAEVQRPIMPSLHAANSIGSFLGAGAGSLVADRLTPLVHFGLLAPVGLVVAGVAGWTLLRHRLDRAPVVAVAEDDGGSAQWTWRSATARLVVLVGIVALCAAFAQGGLDNWVPLHVITDLGSTAGIGAVGYALVQGGLTVGRVVGGWLIERFGEAAVVLGGGVLSVAGLVLGIWAPTTPIALVGLALGGLGLSNIFPFAIARAGELGGPSGVATASTMGYGGIMLAPPLIGVLTDNLGLRASMTVIPILIAVALVVYRVLLSGRARGARARDGAVPATGSA